MGGVEATHRRGPIQGTTVKFTYTWIQIILDPTGSSALCLTNEIAIIALRGIGQWMTKNAIFTASRVGIFYKQYFCGFADVSLLQP